MSICCITVNFMFPTVVFEDYCRILSKFHSGRGPEPPHFCQNGPLSTKRLFDKSNQAENPYLPCATIFCYCSRFQKVFIYTSFNIFRYKCLVSQFISISKCFNVLYLHKMLHLNRCHFYIFLALQEYINDCIVSDKPYGTENDPSDDFLPRKIFDKYTVFKFY